MQYQGMPFPDTAVMIPCLVVVKSLIQQPKVA
jgi:hypothetical protein